MDDKSALLDSLKIDRTPLPEQAPAQRGKRYAIAAAVLVLVLLLGWWRFGGSAVEIQTATARRPDASAAASVLDASGYVVARRRATVSSKITGKVVELNIEEGSRVEQGQVLARIDDSNIRAQLALAQSQLDAARAQLAEVQVQLADAERNRERLRTLAAQKLVSQSSADTAQSNADALRARLESTRRGVEVAQRAVAVQQQNLEDCIVRAPFSGVITVKNAQPGEMISPLSAGGDGTRTGIGTLVDMDSLEVEVDVNENFIHRVETGQRALTALNAYPEWKIPSSVVAVVPTADRSKATVKVRIALQQTDPRILPDMGARVSFLAPPPAAGTKAKAPAVLVPSDTVRRDDHGGGTVFVIRDGRLHQRKVKLGEVRGSDVEISAGLDGGERLALGELDTLHDGQRVKTAGE